MTKLSAILPIKTRGRHYADNIARCDILFSSLRAFTSPATFDRILVVVPHDELALAREYVKAWSDFPIELVDESVHMTAFTEFTQPHQIRPWHRQQIIKLYSPALIDTEFFMVLDPDVFAVQPFTIDDLILDGRALTYPQPRMREPHLWRPSAQLLQQEPHLERDGIWWTPAILSRTLVQALQRRLEELYQRDWIRVLLSNYMIDWTEYTLYWLNAEREGLIERYHTLPPAGRRGLHVNESVWYAGKDGRNLNDWQAGKHFGPDGDGLFAVVQSNTYLPPDRVVDKLGPYFPIRLQPYRRDTDPLRRAVEIYAALTRRALRLLRQAKER
ncbi:DUF6492 family protein [Magnetospirillum molischianum]|uniref:Uncharacterized protein n=1 Tax=Magnetospirillum molischianum DSM 120 TaxID=1150626 RepID=H8FWE1_MAGML|nr:DUF6492 family protein [Magnetospirillum molischianum]CCG42679.1 hypothetical protein PHAMO_400060 [Magnetospirillum molischianum DSM 120]